jgi:hypothetical protein
MNSLLPGAQIVHCALKLTASDSRNVPLALSNIVIQMVTGGSKRSGANHGFAAPMRTILTIDCGIDQWNVSCLEKRALKSDGTSIVFLRGSVQFRLKPEAGQVGRRFGRFALACSAVGRRCPDANPNVISVRHPGRSRGGFEAVPGR